MHNPILAHNSEKQKQALRRIPQCQRVGSKAFCVQRRLKTPLHAPTRSQVERERVVFIYTLESVCVRGERVVSLPGVYVTVMTYSCCEGGETCSVTGSIARSGVCPRFEPCTHKLGRRSLRRGNFVRPAEERNPVGF
jgi:rRNA maturation protein Nop10